MFGQLRTGYVWVLLIVVATLLGTPGKTSAVVVTFPDANLEAAVREKLGIPARTDITDMHMRRLGSFRACVSGVSDIRGLEYAVNLTDLELWGNRVGDISAVSNLTNLTSLNLWKNQISDITAVSGLKNLIELSLGKNRINDITAFSRLANLTSLNLWDNQISDITAVSGLANLTSLDLGVNKISDITAVSGLTNLTSLDLGGNEISDITAVSGLTNLTSLDLGGNEISNITAVSGLTNLTSLALSGNKISDITSVSWLTDLNLLFLSNNQISDTSSLSGMTKLSWLILRNNPISDISAVSELMNLTLLDLDSNQISDISAVSEMTNLAGLHLNGNQIETMDLRGSNLASLECFEIENNPVTKVVLADSTLTQAVFNALVDGGSSIYIGLGELPGIQTLDLSGVDFEETPDLSVIYGMDDLETLLFAGATNLDGSQVTQLTGELDSLAWLDVTGLWESFDAGSQSLLLDWDAIKGHTLVTAVPEPATIVLLSAFAGLMFLRRKRRRVNVLSK